MKNLGIVAVALAAFIVWSTKAYTSTEVVEMGAMFLGLAAITYLYVVCVFASGMWFDIFTIKEYSYGNDALEKLDRECEWLLYAEGP